MAMNSLFLHRVAVVEGENTIAEISSLMMPFLKNCSIVYGIEKTKTHRHV